MVIDVETEVTLKSCPFCGTTPNVRSDGIFNPEAKVNENAYFWVKCANEKCGVSPRFSSNATDAIEKWNRRSM